MQNSWEKWSWTHFKFESQHTPGLKRWLLGQGEAVTVLSPRILVEDMKQTVQEMIDKYKNEGYEMSIFNLLSKKGWRTIRGVKWGGLKKQKGGEILKEGNLRIPSYQRPYKWNRKNISVIFFYDLRDAMGKKEYQVGSVIFHENDGYLDIVDGQQRLISISLFLHLLGNLENYKGANQLLSAEFGEISCYHASENYNEWKI